METLFGNIFTFFHSSKQEHTASSVGFTLIELVVVMAIIGILATGLVIALNPQAQIQRANDAKRKSDLAQIQKALEQYYNDNNAYPVSTGSSGNPTWSIPNGSFGSIWSSYMQTVPQDPTNASSGKKYVYKSANGQNYYLYTSLDNLSDPQLCFAGGTKCANAPAMPACGPNAKCNYGVSSSNTTP